MGGTLASSSRCHRTRYFGKSSSGQAEVSKDTFQGTGKVLYGSFGIFKTTRCGYEPVSGIRGSGLGRHEASPSRKHQSLKAQTKCRITLAVYWRAARVGKSIDFILADGQNGRV